MAFSYSGLRNYGKSTLPSVEAGLGSMNILKDPPKSIYTRRVDKVGQTSDITQMIQDSESRSCEVIKPYARGRNPFVSVEYQNYGNSGGQLSGGVCNASARPMARLPYAIGGAHNDVFRPPMLKQENLLPLSRLPRVWTNVKTTPEFIDFRKKMVVPKTAENTDGIKTNILHVSSRPTCTYQIETPIVEPFEIRHVIQNPINISANSGFRSRDIYKQEVVEPNKGINENIINYSFNTPLGSNNLRHDNDFQVDITKYIQDVNYSDVKTNKYSNKYITPIEDIMDTSFTKNKLKEAHYTDYTTPISSLKSQDYIHDEINLNKNLPNYNATTNNTLNIHKNIIDDPYQYELTRNIPIGDMRSNIGSVLTPGENNITINNYNRLAPKPNKGGFSDTITSINKIEYDRDIREIVSPKQQLGKKASDFFDGRYRFDNRFDENKSLDDYRKMFSQQQIHA